jgi:hypothetical protein
MCPEGKSRIDKPERRGIVQGPPREFLGKFSAALRSQERPHGYNLSGYRRQKAKRVVNLCGRDEM